MLLGWITLGFVYLVSHAREPLRLNLGDPRSDASALSAVRELVGVSDITAFRLCSLAWSALGMWLLFCYARQLYSARVALIATALFSTSLLWLMYADSIHQAPMLTALMFLGLWGLVRSIESGLRRHYAAAVAGCFGAFFVSSYGYLFLPAAVLVTVYLKSGNPFARGRRHFVALCAAGCALGIAAKCLIVIGGTEWDALLADPHFQQFERATASFDRQLRASVTPTLLRRLTLVLSPLVWITAAFHALKAIRAATVTSAIKDTAAWMLVAAIAFVALFPQRAALQVLASQVFLPFYAIGSALIVDRLLEGGTPLRRLGYAWLVAAPLWAFFLVVTHPRALLDRGDVARTNAYLAANDRNDFVMTNIRSAGPIHASFGRHAWSALDSENTTDAAFDMLSIYEMTGTESVHEIIFSGPDSRFIDQSLWPLALPRRQWSVTGWPHLLRRKTNALIAKYDRLVENNLQALKASKVLELGNYAVYRVDREAVLALLGDRVPAATHIDFGSFAATQHTLLGWKPPEETDEHIGVMRLEGFYQCPEPRTPQGNTCKTVLTEYGLTVEHLTKRAGAQLMFRAERACDHTLTFQFATAANAQFTVNGFTAAPSPGRTTAFTVPAANIRVGINVVDIAPEAPLDLATLDIAASCR